MNLADSTFGIGGQARAVLALLESHNRSTSGIDVIQRVETSPWYNGREQGVLFSFGAHTGPVLRIAVFEHRNSDSLCALMWRDDTWGMNPPTIESHQKKAYPTDNKWDVAKSVEWGKIGEMVHWILDQFDEFVSDL